MQSLIFALMLFIVAHLVIYLLFLKRYKGALIYLKIYCFFSALGCLLLTFTETPILIILALAYAGGFMQIRQFLSEKAG